MEKKKPLTNKEVRAMFEAKYPDAKTHEDKVMINELFCIEADQLVKAGELTQGQFKRWGNYRR